VRERERERKRERDRESEKGRERERKRGVTKQQQRDRPAIPTPATHVCVLDVRHDSFICDIQTPLICDVTRLHVTATHVCVLDGLQMCDMTPSYVA